VKSSTPHERIEEEFEELKESVFLIERFEEGLINSFGV
jgi:hypothetical protein